MNSPQRAPVRAITPHHRVLPGGSQLLSLKTIHLITGKTGLSKSKSDHVASLLKTTWAPSAQQVCRTCPLCHTEPHRPSGLAFSFQSPPLLQPFWPLYCSPDLPGEPWQHCACCHPRGSALRLPSAWKLPPPHTHMVCTSLLQAYVKCPRLNETYFDHHIYKTEPPQFIPSTSSLFSFSLAANTF